MASAHKSSMSPPRSVSRWNLPIDVRSASPCLSDEQTIAVRVLNTHFAFRHVVGIRDGRNAHSGCEQVIAQGDEVGCVQVKQYRLLAGDHRLAGTREHQLCAFASYVSPLQSPG